jgi:hypothetical protein
VSRRFVAPKPEVIGSMRAIAERRLSAEEFNAYVNAPMSDEERTEIRELIGWFRRHYPRPLDRLISSRRAYARAARRSPKGIE